MASKRWKRERKRLMSVTCVLAMLLSMIPIPAAFAESSPRTILVTDYGADGTDTNDDKAAIQAAIDAAESGDTVLLPEGTYYLSGTLRGKSGVTIAGADRDQTIVKFASTSDISMIDLHDVTNAVVTNMTLDADHSTIAMAAVRSVRGSHNKMTNLRVQNFAASEGFGPFGLYGEDTDYLEISNNIITNIGVESDWGGAIRVGWGSSHVLIENNTIHNTGRGGIFLNDGCPYSIVRGNTITGTGKKKEGLGIELHTDVDYSLVEHNHVDHWLSAVRSKYVAVRHNVLKATDGSIGNIGLEVMVNHGVVTDNLVDGGQQVGIQQSPGTGYQYWGYNVVRNQVMWGMQLQGAYSEETQQNQYFYKNIIENTQVGNEKAYYPGYDGYGIRIHGNSQNLTFDSNIIRNNGSKAIDITDAPGVNRISFINNIITGNAGPTIDKYPDDAPDLEWSGNVVSGNGTDTQLESRGFADPKPIANFEAPLTVKPGTPVQFVNTSDANGGKIVEYLWDFGEGLPSTEENPTHTYEKEGEYRVTLVVWSELGRASLKEHTIKVTNAPSETPADPGTPGGSTPDHSDQGLDCVSFQPVCIV